jgi:hypothetical protein
MSTGVAAFTFFHVALSLVGIVTGFVVLFALFSAKYSNGWTATFSCYYGCDQRDRVSFSVPQILAFPRRRYRLAIRTGRDDSGPVRFSFGRSLAPDVRHRRRCRPLSQRFCFNRPVFHEDSSAQGTGAHAIGAAFLGTQVVVMLIFSVLGILAAKRSPAEVVQAP